MGLIDSIKQKASSGMTGCEKARENIKEKYAALRFEEPKRHYRQF
jgi:hypothetical protein